MTPSEIAIIDSANKVRRRRVIMKADELCRDYVSTKIIVRYVLETGSPMIPIQFLDAILKDEERTKESRIRLQAMIAMRNIQLSQRIFIREMLKKFIYRFQKLSQEQQQ